MDEKQADDPKQYFLPAPQVRITLMRLLVAIAVFSAVLAGMIKWQGTRDPVFSVVAFFTALACFGIAALLSRQNIGGVLATMVGAFIGGATCFAGAPSLGGPVIGAIAGGFLASVLWQGLWEK